MGRNKVFHGFTDEEIQLQMSKKRKIDRELFELLEHEVCHGFTTDSIDGQVCHGFTTDSIDGQVKKKNKIQKYISSLESDILKMTEVVEKNTETAGEKTMAGKFTIFT